MVPSNVNNTWAFHYLFTGGSSVAAWAGHLGLRTGSSGKAEGLAAALSDGRNGSRCIEHPGLGFAPMLFSFCMVKGPNLEPTSPPFAVFTTDTR